MKFVTFKHEEKEQIGIKLKGAQKIVAITEVKLSKDFTDMNNFIENHTKEDIFSLDKIWKGEVKVEKTLDMKELEVLAPIPKPKNDVICVGLNYKAHLFEVAKDLNVKKEIPTSPVIFGKRARFATGPNGTIPNHADVTECLDYEVELGVVLGKETSKIEKEGVKDSIFGYTIMNDISARDLMVKHKQWLIGKGLDGSVVMGPCIVHKDYIDYPVELNIESKVNNEVRQSSNTSSFIFDIDYLVSELAQGITLEAGDIISTGTPAGVGMSMNPKTFLKAGDTITCTIENIGTMTNTIK